MEVDEEELTDSEAVTGDPEHSLRTLQQELQFFKCLGRGQGCCEDGDDGGPLAHVLYFSSAESVRYRHKIEDFFVSLVSPSSSSHTPSDTDPTHPDAPPMYQPTAVQTSSHCPCSSQTSPLLHVTGSVEYYEGFCVDRLGIPALLVGEELKMPDHLSVVYTQVYSEPFWLDKVEEREVKRLQRMAIKCFNCGDDHHLKDCTEPMDAAVITSRRKEFLAAQGTPGADKRYHVTLMEEERFSKFKAGTLSEKLQQALGMQMGAPPPFLQRMQALGHPPTHHHHHQPDPCLLLYDSPAHPDKGNIDLEFNSKMDSNTAVANGDHEDLGCLSGDYEFEEDESPGAEMVGFGLKKLLHSSSAQEEGEEELPPGHSDHVTVTCCPPRVKFSVDFPPGLVHSTGECHQSSGRWLKLKQILKRES